MSRFSEVLMDHFNSPRNVGVIEHADRVGTAGVPGQGPFIMLCLRIQNDVVVEAQYQTHGCGVTIACGSMITEMIKGRSLEECRAITAAHLSDALGGIPPDKAHSPVLAVAALQQAVGSCD